MEQNRVVNIVNFIRGCEPRDDSIDLLGTVKEEIKLNKEYGFDNTFMIQYDALVNPDYVEILKNAQDDKTEIGLWIELCQPIIEKVGLKWRSDVPWIHYVNPGFLQSYTKSEREMIIDAEFEGFKERFGYYPKTVGAWIIDAYSLNYMAENYDIDAFCICREQYGTDGYTLWGGYYNGGYYPSKNNMLIPAKSDDKKIGVPTFRMLGIDPADAYDKHYKKSVIKSGCRTLEPFWESGATKEWVEWYLKNLCENEDLGFSYTQTGQENSFGWVNFADALRMQFDVIKQMQSENKLKVLKLSDTGKLFKEKFADTPATVYANMDYLGSHNTKSIWYNSVAYRANLFSDDGDIKFRDISIFDENYEEKYINEIETRKTAEYFSYPVMDGYLWGSEEEPSGIYFGKKGDIEKYEKVEDTICATLAFDDKTSAKVKFEENGISIISKSSLSLNFEFDFEKAVDFVGVNGKTLEYNKNGNVYTLEVVKGDIVFADKLSVTTDKNGEIEFAFFGGNR